MLLMSPSMPSGGTFTRDDWRVIADLCMKHDLTLVHDAAMQRLVFDDAVVFDPLQIDGMESRTIAVGAASKELRMIGWRVGWIVAPERFMPDITAVSLANVVAPVGIAQKAAAAGLRLSWTRIGGFSGELQMRRDVLMKELAEGQGLSVGRPAGGWSLLIDVTPFGIDAAEASRRLFADGVAATGMAGWGTERARRFVRLVFANEPVEHLIGVGAVVARGLVARGLANSI
jgi:aspartate/methionine/tyrosine aminotransferase